MQKISILTEYASLSLLDKHVPQPSFPDMEYIYICDTTPAPTLRPSAVYVGSWQAAQPLLAQITENYTALFLLTEAEGVRHSDLECFSCNILLSDQDIYTLYNILNDTLMAWRHWSQRFALLGLQKNNLQSLIELGASMLNTSVILLNAGYSMICYQLHHDRSQFLASFPGLNSLLTRGFLSIQTILQLKEEGNVPILPIRQGADTLAYLLLPELQEGDYAAHTFGTLLTQALRQHMASQSQSHSGHYKIEFEQLIADMIEMNTISEEEIQNRLVLMDASLKRFYCCLVVRLVSQDTSSLPLNQLIGGLEKLFPGSYFAIYQDHVVALVPVAERRLPDYHQEALLTLLERFHASIGMSGPLMRLEQFRTLYLMASSAIRLGSALALSGSPPIYLYNDYRIYHMIDMCREGFINRYHHDNLVYLCHPMASSLHRYDQDHGTDFVDILSTFLQSDSNLTKTARKLNFHRNTMLYKLSKIESIIGDSLEDSTLKQTLLLSCYTIRYIALYLKEDVLKYNPIQKETEGDT